MTQFGNVLKGVALGDSWGDKNEFCTSIERLTDNGREPMGPDLPAKLHVTDDTQMTLFLATALETARDQDMAITKMLIEQTYLSYYNDRLAFDGTRAPGNTVTGSLSKLEYGLPWQKATNPNSDGSGTVMRTSPCAFLPEDQWVGVTAFAAAVTHGAANAIAAAILDVAILRKLLAGNISFGLLLSHALDLATNAERYGLLDVGQWLDGYEVPGGLASGFDELARIIRSALDVLPALRKDPWAMSSDPSLQRDLWQSPSSGGGWRGHQTLVIALLAIDMLSDDPWMALRRSVTTSGDSDTIGAVCGALLGAGMATDGSDGWQTFNESWTELAQRFETEYRSWIEEASGYFEPLGAVLG